MRLPSTFVVAAAFSLLASQAAAQGVNCEQVKRYAQTGRTAEQIAETMIVDLDAVKKCLESSDPAKAPPMSGSAPAGGSGAASGGGEKK
jgi:hypothetical protein